MEIPGAGSPRFHPFYAAACRPVWTTSLYVVVTLFIVLLFPSLPASTGCQSQALVTIGPVPSPALLVARDLTTGDVKVANSPPSSSSPLTFEAHTLVAALDDTSPASIAFLSKVVRQTLTYLGEKEINKEWDRLQFDFSSADIAPYPGKEIILQATLLPDAGYLAVFGHTNPATIQMIGSDSNLSLIKRVCSGDEVGLSPSTLVLIDEYNEMAGAFYRQEEIHLYRWHAAHNQLKKIFRHLYSQEQYSLTPPLAQRMTYTVNIEFSPAELVLHVETNLSQREEETDTYEAIQTTYWVERYRFADMPFAYIRQKL